jgi:putative ABC transport system permease protein
VLRNKGRTLVFIVGICISSIFLLIGLILRSSCVNVIDQELRASDTYEYVYYFFHNQINSLYEEEEPFLRVTYEVENSDATFSLMGIDFDSKLFPLETEQGTSLNPGSIYISKTLSELLGLSKGDTLRFLHPITAEEYSLTIDGIAAVNTQKAIYMTLDNANAFLGNEENTYNAVYSDKELEIDADLLQLSKKASEEAELFEKLLEPVMTVVYVLIVLGALLGVISITIITSIIVEENTTNISMLKVQGYKTKEISKMLLSINKWLVPAGYILSIPAAVIFCRIAFRSEINSLNMYIKTVFTAADFIIGIAVVYAAYFITLILVRRKVMAVNLVDSLKDNREN